MAIHAISSPYVKSILASAARTSTSTAKFTMPMADSYTFFVNCTAASGTSPTLDIVYQTSIDGGTTYVDLPWRHAQITSATANILTVRLGLGLGETVVEQAVADTGGTLAKAAVCDISNMQVKWTVTATTPSFTFSITLIAIGDGASPRSS